MGESGHTFADRLGKAIAGQPKDGRRSGLRLFVSRMKAAEVTGASLSNVQLYLRGESEPTIAWTEAAAGLLGVRAEWLAWGQGAPTEAEEAARRDSPAADLARVHAAMRRALSLPGPAYGDVPTWAPLVRQAALMLHRHHSVDAIVAGRKATISEAESLEAVATAIAAPIRALGLVAFAVDDIHAHVAAVALSIIGALTDYTYTRSEEAEDGEA